MVRFYVRRYGKAKEVNAQPVCNAQKGSHDEAQCEMSRMSDESPSL